MISIRDVARLAGVSVTTVSKVFNNYPDVNVLTRKKVMEIANELQYRPNVLARSLVKKESRIFGYIIAQLQKNTKHTIVQDCLYGIYEFCRENDYEVLMLNVDSKEAKSYEQFAREHAMAGVILHGITSDDQFYKQLISSEIPCVLIDHVTQYLNVGSISCDNLQASREAVNYLIDNGHRNIAYMNGSKGSTVSIHRYEGYVTSLIEHGIIPVKEYVLHGDFSEDIAYFLSKNFLSKHPEVTAMYCASDMMAFGVIKAAEELGMKVPDNLSIIGFDDVSICEYSSPKLTTIHQDFYQLGYESAQLLFNVVKGKELPHSRKVEHKLMIRESVKNISNSTFPHHF